MADDHQFRAFLSYSHADTAMAKKLHARLEGFRIDRDVVGRETDVGPIPANLRPIFRDRTDFDAGGSLADRTVAALDASAALIVLASPHSAKSPYVDEEIRIFKAWFPDRPVIPVIVDGRRGGGDEECYTPSLQHAVDADGNYTGAAPELLGADVRETGDGFDLALAKVVARLIGLPTDAAPSASDGANRGCVRRC